MEDTTHKPSIGMTEGDTGNDSQPVAAIVGGVLSAVVFLLVLVVLLVIALIFAKNWRRTKTYDIQGVVSVTDI